jgi:SAM-dependent methyltransferase
MKNSSEKADVERAPQVEPEHYADLTYDTKGRFISYWHQINLIMSTRPATVLEVGVGNKFVSNYLRNLGVDNHSLDFDERLEPDTVGSVLDLPFEDGQFDVACCFETLEHLPWEEFETAVEELRRVSRRFVLLSLPDRTPYARVDLEWRFHRQIARHLRDLPNLRPEVHEFDGQHYWEIGRKGWPLSRIIEAIERHGLKVEEEFRVFEDPYHRFFRCAVRPT